MSIEKLKPHEKIKMWLLLLEDKDLIKRIRMAFEYFVEQYPGKIVNKNNVTMRCDHPLYDQYEDCYYYKCGATDDIGYYDENNIIQVNEEFTRGCDGPEYVHLGHIKANVLTSENYKELIDESLKEGS